MLFTAIIPVIIVVSVGGIIYNLIHLEKTKKFTHYYRTSQWFDNEHMYMVDEEDLFQRDWYYNGQILEKYETGKIEEGAIEETVLKLYVGEGENTCELVFYISNNDIDFSSLDYLNWVSLEQKEQVAPTPDEYKRLISTALDVFYHSNENTIYSDYRVKELLEENEDAIKGILIKTEKLGKEKLRIRGFKWGLSIIELIVALIGISFLYFCHKKSKHESDEKDILIILSVWENYVFCEKGKNISWVNALRNNNAAFCEAEQNRIKALQEYLDQYGAEDKILTSFEKKLVKKMTNEEKIKVFLVFE